ncbi:hypothetical protein [Halocatena pleomorpha]|uniref:hypothetical protein n=1 Tax=Halocatena pleomorpha TaxID=1785090 RepID=UPI001F41BD65|nr:hypothetical protein [Halocatena pleomorpha]
MYHEAMQRLLASDEDLIRIGRVLMDREFDRQHVLEAISERGHDYLVPERKRTSKKAVASRMEQHNVKTAVNERGLHLGNNEWHDTILLHLPKRNFNGDIEEGHERYVVFMSSEPIHGLVGAHIGLYNDRQEIEAGYKQVERFMAKTRTSFPSSPSASVSCRVFSASGAVRTPVVEAKARPNQADLAVTLIHEYAHALLHFDVDDEAERSKREVEAEAVAYIVGRFLGLDTSGLAFYLAAWQDDDPGMIQDRLGRISSTAQEIIDVVDN